MSIVVKKTQSLAIEKETTEGVYVAPASAESFVQVLSDGLEITPSKELLERDIATASIGKIMPRTGTKSVSASVGTEFRANSVEGEAPEFDKLIESCLGTKKQISSEITTKTGNTSSVLNIEDSDIADLDVNDIVLVKKAGAYHVSPISAKSSTPGSATVTLRIPHPGGALPDNVVIAKATIYKPAETGHPTLSLTRYQNSAVRTKAMGCRVNSMEVSSFATGQIPTLNYGLDGLNFDEDLSAPAYTPSYDEALPPIALKGGIYMDGQAIDINEMAFSVSNTVSFATSISSENGKLYGAATGREVTGSINPYKQSDSVSNFTKFVNNTPFSLFAYLSNPKVGVAGEFENIIAVYKPNCLITSVSEGDADGFVQQTLEYSANRGASGTVDEIVIAFI